MSRTYKDQIRHDLNNGKRRYDSINNASFWYGFSKQLQRLTNRSMRRHKGFIKSGCQYKKMFHTDWDFW